MEPAGVATGGEGPIIRHYVTVDVFTDRMFGGNPLAVILDACGLSTDDMQALAREFNYSETAFVLPPGSARHSARLRVFTPQTELPFAGHPGIGTAFALATQRQLQGQEVSATYSFEMEAGVVVVKLQDPAGRNGGGRLQAPRSLVRGPTVPSEQVAAALSLDASDILTATHAPLIVSVGLPFLIVELRSDTALARAMPDLYAYQRLLPVGGADTIYAYVRADDDRLRSITARAFSPLDGIGEDPATGSAAAATAGLMCDLTEMSELELAVFQGLEVGRPSRLKASAVRVHGEIHASVEGQCIGVMSGTFRL